MTRAAHSARRKLMRIGLSVAALVVVAVGGTFLASAPASATWTSFEGRGTCDCVIKEGDRYRAVFGYVNETDKIGRYEAGKDNTVTGSAGTKVVTKFEPGVHKAAFTSGWVSKNEVVTWHVGTQKVTATWQKRPCDTRVSLPADGNGSGPVVALAASLLIAAGVVLFRRFRHTPRLPKAE